MKSGGLKGQIDPAARWVGPRGRLILQTGAWSIVAKAAVAANLFLTVPFVLHALGPAQFGVWATLVSLVAFAGFLDFGLGNGTMNLIAAAHGRGAHHEIGPILSEGCRTLLWISLWLGIAAAFMLPLIPWTRLLGLPGESAIAARLAVSVVLFTIVLAVPLNLANRAQLGLGRGDRVFRWQALGQIVTVMVVIGLAKSEASLVMLVTASVSTPLLASVANTWALWRDPRVAPLAPTRNPEIASRIRREGLQFFVLQLAAALAFTFDLPLISALRGPTDAGTYAIVQRLFSVIPLSLGLVWAPLWPIYRHALAAGNHDWVIRTLRRSLQLAATAAIVAALALCLGFGHITPLWVHEPFVVSGALLVGFALWTVIDAIGTALATFFNAASIMRYQIVVASVFALTCVAAKIWAISRFGITAAPWVTVTTYAVISLLPTLILGPRLITAALAKDY